MQLKKFNKTFSPSSNSVLLSNIISYGSIERGLESQQFIKTASGVSLMPGVLLKGLVLKAFHSPESLARDF